jgi:hypothetical protein
VRVADLAAGMRRIIAPQKAIEYMNREMSGNPTRWCADMTACRAIIPNWTPRLLSITRAQCIERWHAQGGRKWVCLQPCRPWHDRMPGWKIMLDITT